jgi:hypothetical protein
VETTIPIRLHVFYMKSNLILPPLGMYHRKFMEDPFINQAHSTKTYRRWLIDILSKVHHL